MPILWQMTKQVVNDLFLPGKIKCFDGVPCTKIKNKMYFIVDFYLQYLVHYQPHIVGILLHVVFSEGITSVVQHMQIIKGELIVYFDQQQCLTNRSHQLVDSCFLHNNIFVISEL